MLNNKNQTPQVVSFSYLNNPIRFSVNGCVMINATNMAKPFKKQVAHWLKLKATKEFLRTFSVIRKIITADLVRVTQGGNPRLQGTWMHEDVAIEFARWLSPEFAIWCNDRIKEILQVAQTPSIQNYSIYESLRRQFEKPKINLYSTAIFKAFYEFIQEESKDYLQADVRLVHKIKAAQMLFPEDRKKLRKPAF